MSEHGSLVGSGDGYRELQWNVGPGGISWHHCRAVAHRLDQRYAVVVVIWGHLKSVGGFHVVKSGARVWREANSTMVRKMLTTVG